MGIHQIDKIGDYVRYLQENSQELDLLFKELLIGVTSFFRDAACWEELRENILPALLASRPARSCAAGVGARLLHRRGSVFAGHGVQGGDGEASSLGRKSRLQVFATDLDKDAIDKARRAFIRQILPPTCRRNG